MNNYHKRCSKCNETKSATFFYKCCYRKDGYNVHCKSCVAAAAKRNSKQLNAYHAEYRRGNKGRAYFNYKTAERRARKNKATPKWLSDEQLLQIKEIYKQGQEQQLQVDHIIPLKGKTVCGLHVPWNLQLLTPAANVEKSNKLIL